MSTPLDKVFSIDNILSQKLSVIDAVTKKKQEAINPDVAALKQYWAEYDADVTRRMAESPRLPHELTEDAANAMARTTTNLVGGTLALGLSLDAVNPASEIGEAIGLPQEGRELVQKARGAVVNKTADIDKILARRMSKTSQINEALVAQANAADQQRNAVAYEGAVADGAIPLVAGAAELGKNIVAGGGNLVDNPVALGNAVIGQVPTLAVGLGANLAVRVEGVAARAALLAEARGMGMEEAAKLARTQLATRNLMAGVGGTEAGGAFQGAAEGILDPNVSLDQLAQIYPEIQERMAAGDDEISIRGDLASKAGLTAAAIQGPLAAIASRIAANFELNPVGLGGNATKGLVAKTTAGAADVGKEAIEETIQSGTGQLATNLGQIAAGNVEVDALDEVGVAAGAGGVAGAGMAAGFKAPGLVGTTTAAGAKAVYEAGKRTISKRFADIEARVEAEVGPQRAAVAARTEANLQRAESRMAAANITAPASVSVADEPILSPETKADLGANEEDVTGTAGLGRAMKLLGSKELPAERREELSLYAYKQALNLGAVAEQARGQLESMPEDDPLRPSMQAVYDTVLESLQDPGFQEVVSFLQNQEPEAIQAKLDAVPVDYDPTTADAATTQAFESVKTLAYAAPDKFTPEGARKTGALFQSLGNDADKVQGKLIIDVADIKAAYEEQAAQIQANYPEAKVKSSNMVTREIADKGFSFTKRDGSTVKLSSVADYVSSVSQAMAAGQVQIAAKRMAGLMNFAMHMSNKAQAFDSGAIELIDAGLQNDPKARKSLNYSTLDASGKPTKAATAFVSLATDGGMALVDSVFADAEAVTSAFNSLVQAYPAAAKILKAAPLPGPGQVKWKSHTAPEPEVVPEAPQEAVAAVSTPTASTEPAQVKPVQEAVQELLAKASAPALQELISRIPSERAQESAQAFINGELSLENGIKVTFPNSILERAVVLVRKVVEGWKSYPEKGTYAEQGAWLRGRGKDVPMPAEITDLLEEAIQASEAVRQYGDPLKVTAAEISGQPFEQAVIQDWTKGRRIIDEIVDMENLCLGTSKHVAWLLQAHGFSAAVGHGSVRVSNSDSKMMDHYVAIVEIEGERFIVDQPQSELFTPTGVGNRVKIKTRVFTPRFIPMNQLAEAYDTPNVSFTLSANVQMKSLPLKDFIKQIDKNVPREVTQTKEEIIAQGQALLGDTQPVVDFGTEERAAPEELAAALAMTPESYLAAVNPEGKTTPAATDEAIQEELDDMEAPADAPVIGQVDGLELKANGDFLYAVDGDRVIGLLVHKEDGTTLMVNKDYRGRGVGKALMKELLVRKPLAKTNGMSELAKATRLSVLRDLRGDKKKPTTIQERFAGLIQSIGDGLGSVNQFIAGFRLRKSSRSAMNRMENPTEEMLAMINQAIEAKDPEMVKSLFVEDQRLLKVGADQVQALRTLFADAVPMIVQQLNANLQAASRGEQTSLKGVKSKAKGFLARFVADGAKEWSYQNRKTLHVTKVTEDRKNLEYQPEVVEGMALAAVHWAIANINNPVNYDENKIEAMFPEGVSDEIREAFRKYHFFEQPNRNLAREIQEMLAVSANPAAPLNYSDGLSKQLASDTLRALHDLGIITIRTEDLENKKTLNFIEFNKDTQPKWDGTGLLSLQGVRDQLGKPSLLTRLLLPDSRDVASIGKPPAKSSFVVRGTNTPLSAQQRQNIEVLENIPFKLNMPFLEFTSKLGPRFKELVGFTPGELTEVNVRDLVSVDGINRGIDAAMGNLADMYEQMLNYAEENGMAVEDVPVHFGWEVISNGRMMMTAAGPQSNKILREIFSANHSTVDLKNVDQMKELGLAVAQAMGIKTEQKSNIEAINELQDMFAKPGYAELFESLRALDAQEDADPALADQVFEQLQDLGINSERAIHAAHVWARFEVADENVPFKHALAFELDGKTDGPINALVHFGLWNFTEKQLMQLKQGGFIIDDPMKPTLNAQGKQLGDLYGTSAKNLQEQIPKLLADAQRMPGRLKILNASKDLLLFLGHAGMTESESGSALEIKRSVAKHGVMATNYGSGLRSIVSVIAFEFTDKLYAEITKTIREGGLLDENLIEMTETLVGHALPDLYNPNTYQSFQLRRGDTTTILENLLGTKKAPGVGRALVAGITSEMAPIVETFKVLYKSTAAQVFSMRRSFTAAYKAKHAELVAAGKIMPQDALSREQEQEIIKQFADQMPIFKLMLASGAGEGLNVSQRDFAGELQLDGRRTEKVEAITGGLSMDINATSFPDPGVRAAALFTIALGDATMMSQMFLKAGNMLNVYDGLEVTVGEIAQRALEVNKAVWEGWQYDALSAAADSFEQVRINVKELTEAEVIELADSLRYEHEGVAIADVRKDLEAELTDTQWHLRTLAIKNQAAKRAIAKRHVAVDHMSGGERPYVIENDAEGDTVASIQRDMALFEEEMHAQYVKGLQPTTAQVDKNLSDRLGLTGSDAVRDIAELDKFELEWMLSDYVFPNKLHRFIFDQIKHLLPDNLRVFIGSPAAIARAKTEQFDGVDLGGPREVGAYYKDTIFLSVASPETLVHELVHATSLHLIESFYLNNGKGLTTAQKDAVRSLELLSKRFVEIETDKMPAETAEAVERAQAVVYAYLREGNIPFAVNEFMAWTLTNPQIARAMQKTSRLETLKMLAKSVLATVRKLLGLPNNQAIETFFEQSLGHFHRLVRRESAAPSGMSLMALFQSLGGPTTAHETHLQDTMVNLERVISGVPDHLRTVEQHERALDALTQAANIREQFLDAGFRFTDKEATVFGLVHAVFASAAALDPVTMTSFQEIQRQVMPNLEPEDFLEDRDSATEGEMQEARRKFNALFQIYTEDKSGRSNLLANFVGLAMVHEPLRKKLSTMTAPRQTLKRETLDETLRNGVRVAFDKLSDTVLRIGGDAAQTRNLDTLVLRLAETQEQLGARLAARESPLGKVDAEIKNYQQRAAGLLQPYIDRRIAGDRKFSKIDGYINLALVAAKGLLTDEGADAFQRGAETFINLLEAPKFVRELLGELLGMTDSSAAVGQLLTRTKHAIARVRQRLREEGPGIVRDLFEKKYDHNTWESMYRSVASTDLQSLMSTYSLEGVTQMVQDDVSLDQEIASAEAELEAKHRNLWIQGVEDLAGWMVNRQNNAVLLRRNAHALSKLVGSPVQVSVSSAQAAEPILDRLISLHAIKLLKRADRDVLADMLTQEAKGMKGMMRLMRSLAESERGKPGADLQALNAWKGYAPISMDPRTDLVLAGPDKGAQLLKRGYRLVAPYAGDSVDTSAGMAYYATSLSPGKFELISGGKPTFNQGAMQTVQATVMGVDKLTGQTLDASTNSMITAEETVDFITARKMRMTKSQSNVNLIPVFDFEGKIVAYERVMDHAFLEQHLRVNKDLANSIGAWMGRQAEESLARSFNGELVQILKNNWDEGVSDGREKEYVDLLSEKDPTVRDAWNAIPRETQEQMLDLFDGRVMVQKNMINNALGYRSASVADVFTGVSNLPEPVRAGLEKAALGMFGLNAYRYLYTAERTWQGLVGQAKDWIVVRSGVVMLANGFANQFQLLQMGVPLKTLIPAQIRKIKETEQFLRNERRIAQLRVAISAVTQVGKKRELEQEARLLQDENMRLSIYPLIQAGELPSITEGLSEQDEYSLLHDIVGWVEKKMEKLPKGLSTTARYAVIAKDTALYQGLNRGIQFGDFMAKAALYDHLLSTGLTKDEALLKISESFVNYNLMAGRSRDYLESMGLTWFLNYKLRIQKIVLRNIRENPLRFLLAGMGAEVLGADSLITSAAPNANWEYGFGPGPFFRAHDMLAWKQLF